MNKKDKDLRKVAKRENYFSTLARKEGKGAQKRAKAESREGLKESAKDSKREEKWDMSFAKKRKKIATAAKIKVKK